MRILILKICFLCKVLEFSAAPQRIVDEIELFNNDINPEEGAYFEGDIILPQLVRNPTVLFRNGLLLPQFRWINGVVPIEISGSFSKSEMATIYKAFDEYQNKTCIRFVQRSTEADYVIISNQKAGCWSSVGRQGGAQTLNLKSKSCFAKYGTILHELMHVLGFLHEQTRYERDEYVKILLTNILPGKARNFFKASNESTYAYGEVYDFGSVMHYGSKSFSKNGKPTIVPLINQSYATSVMGQRKGFSLGDLNKINAMYDCYSSDLQLSNEIDNLN